MNKIKSIVTLVLSCLLAVVGLTACSEDDLSTNQYQKGVHLNVFGPSPVMRGGSVHFYGSNLDRVKQVIIPGMDPVTNFEVVKAGVPSEIVVVLDKDKPQPGTVTLITDTDEKIETLTSLTYIEGIEYDSEKPLVPDVVQPGAVLTINGEYLNLVKEIIFADNIVVISDNFVSQSRYMIEVTVPEEARTGKVILSDGAEIPNWIYSDGILDVSTPVIAKLASPRGEAEPMATVVVKTGEQITVTGEALHLVGGLKFGDEENVFETEEFTVSEDGKTLTFALPAEAPDGDLNIVCRSGVEVPVGVIETVAPSNCVAAPAPVKAGAALTITGNDMDVVEAVEMPNVTDAIEIENDGTKVTVKAVPETATEGNLVLRMKNGKGVDVLFTLVKPVVTEYDNASVSAGGALVIKGTDLDLVKSIKFGDSDEMTEFTAQSAESITLTVPMNAQSGAPTLTLANGTTVENVPELNVSEAVFCYVTEWPGEEAEIKAGETITVKVANGDKLTGVEIKGQSCQFVISGQDKDQLVIGVPQNAGKDSDVRLISSNGEISYKFDFIPQGEITNVIFNGPFELTWSTSTQGMIPQLAFADLPAGAEVTLNVDYTVTGADPKMKVNNGSWGHIILETGLAPAEETLYSFDPNATTFSIAISAEAAANITASATDWGGSLIIHGQDAIINKIYLTIKQSLETAVWTGSWACSGWGGNQDLAWGGYDWSTVKANSTVRFYWSKITTGTWGCISLRHGDSWGALPEPILGQYDFADEADNGVLEVQFPQNVLDDLNANGGLVITGDNYTLTKVTVE